MEETIYSKTLSIDNFSAEAQNIIGYYECPLCKGITFQPVADSCGHLYCEKCFKLYISKGNKHCPVDSCELTTNASSPIVVINLLNRQIINCSNKAHDCQWKGKIENYEHHMNNECLKQIIKCVNKGCSKDILREELPEHLKDCDYRMDICKHCSGEFSFIQLRVHYDACPQALIICPQLCGGDVVREQLKNHIQNDCLNTKICCNYANLGCKSMVIKRDLQKHLEDNILTHLVMMYSVIRTMKTDLERRADDLNVVMRQIEMKHAKSRMIRDKNKSIKHQLVNDNHFKAIQLPAPDKFIQKKRNREEDK